MKLLTLYFSGTGNTDYAARYLHRKLQSLALPADLKSIEIISPQETSGYDVLLMGFPVYSGKAPDFFKRYVDALPPGNQRGVFVFCTRAMFSGLAVKDLYRQLEAKGYLPLGHAEVAMPGSDALPFLRPDSKYVKKALLRDYQFFPGLDEIAAKVLDVQKALETSTGFCREHDPKSLPLITGALNFLWDFAYGFAEKLIKPKFRADDRCTRCGLCVKQCPAENIGLNEEAIFFGSHCYLCMRCINQCPRHAIQIGRATVNKFRWKGPGGDFKPARP